MSEKFLRKIPRKLKPMFGFLKSVSRATTSNSGPHGGMHYREYLRLVHEAIGPANYFEIGVKAGKSFRLARCPALGVDPFFSLKAEVDPIGLDKRSSTHIFKCTSDDFFSKVALKQFFPTGVDFAFLDGMHLFEYLLRDFISTEESAHARAVIALHDCHPTSTAMAMRNRDEGNGWAGDVWKLLPILREYRPDLQVRVVDCPPTGLALIVGLAPGSATLRMNYDTIVENYEALTLEEYGLERLREQFPALDSRKLSEPAAICNLLNRNASHHSQRKPLLEASDRTGDVSRNG